MACICRLGHALAAVATCCGSYFYLYFSLWYSAPIGAWKFMRKRARLILIFSPLTRPRYKTSRPPSWGFSAENSICYKMCAAFCISSSKIRDLQFSFRFPAPQSPQSRILSSSFVMTRQCSGTMASCHETHCTEGQIKSRLYLFFKINLTRFKLNIFNKL